MLIKYYEYSYCVDFVVVYSPDLIWPLKKIVSLLYIYIYIDRQVNSFRQYRFFYCYIHCRPPSLVEYESKIFYRPVFILERCAGIRTKQTFSGWCMMGGREGGDWYNENPKIMFCEVFFNTADRNLIIDGLKWLYNFVFIFRHIHRLEWYNTPNTETEQFLILFDSGVPIGWMEAKLTKKTFPATGRVLQYKKKTNFKIELFINRII